MIRTSPILLFGHDTTLLQTRRLILALDGFGCESVQSLRAVTQSLLARPYGALVICHTVSQPERRTGASLAASLSPAVAAVALMTDWSEEPGAPLATILHTRAGPGGFRASVRCLLHVNDLPTGSRERKSAMASLEGTVKWFNNAKGYGFLGRNDGGSDVFTHYSSIQTAGYKSLKPGDLVSFDVIQGEKGPQADQVRLLDQK